ncbi:MAG: hypothetical protein BRD21_08735 [Halobacteriales archaeon SW_8_66_22]|nr:MAG: hypothetical protein BRD21_08735 [Halobacteriales archaeon SW_8_66_22]
MTDNQAETASPPGTETTAAAAAGESSRTGAPPVDDSVESPANGPTQPADSTATTRTVATSGVRSLTTGRSAPCRLSLAVAPESKR